MRKKILIYITLLITACLLFSSYNVKADSKTCYDYNVETNTTMIGSSHWKKANNTVTCEYNYNIDGKNWHFILYNGGSGSYVNKCLIIEDGNPLTKDKNYWSDSKFFNFNAVTAEKWPTGKCDYHDNDNKYFVYYWEIAAKSKDWTFASQSDCPEIKLLEKQDIPRESCDRTVTSGGYTTYSYRGEELKVVYIIGMALLMIRIVVPILLIITGMIGLVKAMTKNDDRDIQAELKKLVPKLLAAIIIFILPTLISGILSLIKQDNLWKTYSDCLLKPTTCDVQFDWE